ncbi:MAG: NYN domain-containing protein [Candidatus Magasanikbacteria bacterium]|nr:NYN domain-containing protein [Candidatus Magasanikbacteria bacterium]
MKLTDRNFAYIDGANLHNGAKQLGWQLDYGRLRIWLREKYRVEQAYLFLGLVPKYKNLYTYLQEIGFTLVFKEVTYDDNGKIKGNCDADLVVRVMRDAYENTFNKAILVSSDGDYASLVAFLGEKQKIQVILSPYETRRCSILLKRTGVAIAYINDQKTVLQAQKEKTPDADRTA